MGLDVNFPVSADMVVTPETVKKYFGIVKNLFNMVKGFASMTGNTSILKVVDYIEFALTAVEPYLEQEWVYAAINTIIGLFVKHPSGKALEVISTKIAELN